MRIFDASSSSIQLISSPCTGAMPIGIVVTVAGGALCWLLMLTTDDLCRQQYSRSRMALFLWHEPQKPSLVNYSTSARVREVKILALGDMTGEFQFSLDPSAFGTCAGETAGRPHVCRGARHVEALPGQRESHQSRPLLKQNSEDPAGSRRNRRTLSRTSRTAQMQGEQPISL